MREQLAWTAMSIDRENHRRAAHHQSMNGPLKWPAIDSSIIQFMGDEALRTPTNLTHNRARVNSMIPWVAVLGLSGFHAETRFVALSCSFPPRTRLTRHFFSERTPSTPTGKHGRPGWCLAALKGLAFIEETDIHCCRAKLCVTKLQASFP